MKAINAVKKMVAVGTAATMLGATIMGASAASLGAFPRPFVVDGVPANNFLMAVGKSAAGEDVVGAIDIIQYLQQKLSVPSSGDGRRARVTTGDYVEIGRPTDILELGETIGSVVETVTEADLPTLLPRFVFNPANGAVTVVNQYLRFPDTSNELVNFTSSNQVQYAKDEFDNVGYFFRVQNNAPVVTWLGQFEEGAESDINSISGQTTTFGTTGGTSGPKRLSSFLDRDFNILGVWYILTDSQMNAVDADSSGNFTSSDRGDLEVTMVGGPNILKMSEGQSEEVEVDGRNYKITVDHISESTGDVTLTVNGKTFPSLQIGVLYPAPDGTVFAIARSRFTSKDTQPSLTWVVVGATKLKLRDDNCRDSNFFKNGARANEETLQFVDVRIQCQLSTGNPFTATRITLEALEARMIGNGINGEIFVPIGHGVREYHLEPLTFLSPDWDILFVGLRDVGTDETKLVASGRNEYIWQGTNLAGVKQVGEVFSVPSANVVFKGDVSGSSTLRNFWTQEPVLPMVFSQDLFKETQNLTTPSRPNVNETNPVADHVVDSFATLAAASAASSGRTARYDPTGQFRIRIKDKVLLANVRSTIPRLSAASATSLSFDPSGTGTGGNVFGALAPPLPFSTAPSNTVGTVVASLSLSAGAAAGGATVQTSNPIGTASVSGLRVSYLANESFETQFDEVRTSNRDVCRFQHPLDNTDRPNCWQDVLNKIVSSGDTDFPGIALGGSHTDNRAIGQIVRIDAFDSARNVLTYTQEGGTTKEAPCLEKYIAAHDLQQNVTSGGAQPCPIIEGSVPNGVGFSSVTAPFNAAAPCSTTNFPANNTGPIGNRVCEGRIIEAGVSYKYQMNLDKFSTGEPGVMRIDLNGDTFFQGGSSVFATLSGMLVLFDDALGANPVLAQTGKESSGNPVTILWAGNTSASSNLATNVTNTTSVVNLTGTAGCFTSGAGKPINCPNRVISPGTTSCAAGTLSNGSTDTAVSMAGACPGGLTITHEMPSKQFDANGGPAVVAVHLAPNPSQTTIASIRGLAGVTFFSHRTELEIQSGVDTMNYGIYAELFTPGSTVIPEELTLIAPLSETEVIVRVQVGLKGQEGRVGTRTLSAAAGGPALRIGAAVTDDEVSDVRQYNAIVVGGPCANKLAAKLMNNPEPCWEAVPAGKALIKLYEQGSNMALLVAGREAMHTRYASRFVATGGLERTGDATEVLVSGRSFTDLGFEKVK